MRRLERVSVIQETHTSAWYRCTNITPKHKSLEGKEPVTYGLETLVFSPWVWSGANVERGQEGEAGEVRQDSLERKFCWTHVENTCSHYFCFVWLLLQADPKYETSDNTLDFFFFSEPNVLFFSHWDNSWCVCLWPLSVIYSYPACFFPVQQLVSALTAKSLPSQVWLTEKHTYSKSTQKSNLTSVLLLKEMQGRHLENSLKTGQEHSDTSRHLALSLWGFTAQRLRCTESTKT